MKFLKLILLFIGTLLLILLDGTYFQEKQIVAQAERLIPTVTELDFNKVRFVLWTKHEYHERLYARAISQLTEAGLYNKSNRSKADTDKEGAPVLELTLDPKPLDA